MPKSVIHDVLAAWSVGHRNLMLTMMIIMIMMLVMMMMMMMIMIMMMMIMILLMKIGMIIIPTSALWAFAAWGMTHVHNWNVL